MFITDVSVKILVADATCSVAREPGVFVSRDYEDTVLDYYFTIDTSLRGQVLPTVFLTQYITAALGDKPATPLPWYQVAILPCDADEVTFTLSESTTGLMLTASYCGIHTRTGGVFNHPIDLYI